MSECGGCSKRAEQVKMSKEQVDAMILAGKKQLEILQNKPAKEVCYDTHKPWCHCKKCGYYNRYCICSIIK